MKNLHSTKRGLSVGLAVGGLVCCLGTEPTGWAGPVGTGPVDKLPDAKQALFRLPKEAKLLRADLDLSLKPGEEKFSGQVALHVQVEKPTNVITLHASPDLTLSTVRVKTATGEVTPTWKTVAEGVVQLAVPKPLSVGAATVQIGYTGKLPLAENKGLFRQKDGADFYIYSHFEPTDARRAFPCFDEPTFKVPWRVTLHVPKEFMALSNAPLESEQPEAQGQKRVTFKETPPLPSYLLAFAVGPFGVFDAGKAGKKGTPIRIITLRGHEAEGDYAAKATVRLLSLLEDYFGIPYPYEKLDQIAVPGQQGAMENPGLITYGQPFIQIRKTEETVRARRMFSSIAAHELGHQWTGNLVTLAFWDDVWLNESLATFLDSKILGRFHPEWREDQSRVQRRQGAMGADSLATARKIRQPIETQHDIVNAFDGITYSKGAAVLEMFEQWLGEDVFARGLSRYLREKAHQNGTTADLVGAWKKEIAATAKVSGESGAADKANQFEQAFSSFLDQPGFPVVTASLSCEKAGAQLRLSQKRYVPLGTKGESPEVYRFPVCVRYPGQGQNPVSHCDLLTEKETIWSLPNAACPEYVVVNADAVGYFRVNYAPKLAEALRKVGFGKTGVLRETERIAFLGDQAALFRTGEATAMQVLGLSQVAAQDESRHVVAQAAGLWGGIERLLEPSQIPAYRRKILATFLPRFAKLGLVGAAQDDDNVKTLRSVLAYWVGEEGAAPQIVKQATELSQKWLKNPGSVDAETARMVLGIAAKHGDAALFDALLAAAKTESDRNQRGRLLNALGSFEKPPLAQRALDLFHQGVFPIQESRTLLWGPLGNKETQKMPLGYVKAHFEELVAKLPKESGAYLSAMGGVVCSEKDRTEVAEFFADRSTKYAGGPRILSQTLERIDQCVAQKKAHSKSLAAFLKTP